MCGISAFIDIHGRPPESGSAAPPDGKEHGEGVHQAFNPSLASRLDESLDLIHHRGPDERGSWISNDARVGMSRCSTYPIAQD